MAKVVEREHALLSASASHKWLHCPPSARLEDSMPDNTSGAADEGTLAHAICELKLKKLFTDKTMSTRTFNSRMKKLTENELYNPEMDRFTEEYVDYIRELAFSMETTPTIVVEKRIDYSAYAPEGFGTGDCILLRGEELHVIDFKYGKGVAVSAEDNTQLKLYALGAMAEYGILYPIRQVTLHIIQPRLRSFTSWETTAKELLAWGESIKPVAQQAFEGTGEFRQGPWCDSCFCKISGTCRCRADENMKLMDDSIDPISGAIRQPAELSNEEIGAILKKAQFLKSWVTKLEKHALNTIVSGGEIPGWKIVEGRSNRTFSDTDAAINAAINAGFDRALFYEENPVTLTAMEGILDKDTWKNVITPFVVKPPGSPTLAPADDKRPEYKMNTAAEAFGGDNKYKEE